MNKTADVTDQTPATLLALTLDKLWQLGDQHVPGLRAGMKLKSQIERALLIARLRHIEAAPANRIQQLER